MPYSRYLNEHAIDIAAGRVLNTRSIDKFGFRSVVPQTFATVWEGTANVYSYIVTPGTAVVTSTNTAADNGSILRVQGLDVNFNEIQEDLIIGGAAGTQLFFRVFRAYLLTATTGVSNVGTISVTVDGKQAAVITPTNGQTKMALYTVPTGHEAYFSQFQGSVNKNQDAEFRVLMREHQAPFLNKGQWGTFGVPVNYAYEIPVKLNEHTDIEIQSKCGATAGTGALFHILLVKKGAV